MRDPFAWSFPLGTLFRIAIRIHVLFPLVAVALVLRAAFPKEGPSPPGFWVEAVVVVIVLFVSVLLHEFGHCFAARAVDGDAHEILLWPLGGLAGLEVPHTPRAHFIATAGGPAVNLFICVFTGLILAGSALSPPLLFWKTDPYAPRLYNWKDHIYYGSKYAEGDPIYVVGRAPGAPDQYVDPHTPGAELLRVRPGEMATSKEGGGAVLASNPNIKLMSVGRAELGWKGLVARFFWINWVLLLLNVLLVAYPLDGGRLLQSVLWRYTSFRQAMLTTIFFGYVIMLFVGIYAIVADSVLFLVLAIIIYVSTRQQLLLLETGGEESLFGYDFSQGYTSLERDRPPPPRRPNFIQRWLQRRAQRRMQREQETREAEERRMDELLEKVQQQGLPSLTDEERRFLHRVSAKYRNRQ